MNAMCNFMKELVKNRHKMMNDSAQPPPRDSNSFIVITIFTR